MGAKVASKGRRRVNAALERFHEESDLQNVYDLGIIARLWPFLRTEKRPLLISVGLLIVSAAFALGRPLIMKGGLDSATGPEGSGAVMTAGLLLTLVIVLEQGIMFPQMYLMQVAGARAMAAMRSHTFGFLHSRSLAFFDRTPVGRLVTRVTNDIDSIGEVFSSGALNAIGDLIRLVAIVSIMLSMDWQMTLIALGCLPFVAIGVNWTRTRLRTAFRTVRLKLARMNTYLNEQVSGMSVVQAYAQESRSAEEFDDFNDAYRRANNASIAYDASLDAAIEMVSSICIACILWFAGFRGMSGEMTFGTLFAFIAYVEMFFVPVRDISARYSLLQSALAGAERVFDLLDNRDEDAPGGDATDDPKHEGAVLEMDGVTFSYKAGTPVLEEVSLSADAGERIALVGATGAGKSTVASLFLRLYDPQDGQVRVMGRPTTAWSPEALRRRFAVVPQDVFLFPGSIASNIAAGEAEVDGEKVRRALERIDALAYFEARAGGLDAHVLERGSNLSAGERQLIAFARALYRDPPFLILDEATANVDSDTEAKLQRAVDAAMRGRTALVIAHRLSTIRAADRIVVFHKGRVVETGSHDALLARGGTYAKLHRLQFGADGGTTAP